jgi:putative serine protease PepD
MAARAAGVMIAKRRDKRRDEVAERMRRARKLAPASGVVAAAVIAALTLASCSSGRSATASPSSPTPALITPSATAGTPGAVLQQEFVNEVNKVRSSVVEISTSSGLGSGVVFDAQGDIVTNDHVVGTATQFQVTYFTGQTVTGSLVGAYPADDLAVIKAAPSNGVTPATFADSTKLQIGDIALAIGNPLGLASSVTEGIVSFVGRTVPEGNGVVLPDVVQTSADINPGNSGGALVGIDGQVIGIPTLAASDPQLGGGAAPGIGFALPSDVAKLIAGQLVSQGKVTNGGRATLGITGANSVNQSGQPGGVIVRAAQPGGPAANAGMQTGDVIVQINGQQTPSLSVLHGILAGLSAGSASVSIVHANGSQQTVQVSLTNLPG